MAGVLGAPWYSSISTRFAMVASKRGTFQGGRQRTSYSKDLAVRDITPYPAVAANFIIRRTSVGKTGLVSMWSMQKGRHG